MNAVIFLPFCNLPHRQCNLHERLFFFHFVKVIFLPFEDDHLITSTKTKIPLLVGEEPLTSLWGLTPAVLILKPMYILVILGCYIFKGTLEYK
ncbi:hypothetical protein MtrunA17_Chr7g0272041 [Medicago truncatula]|uniref:Transmembrane protein n=1 Tax=Medicago truncatula TaxID=3880 RepID=A0A396HE93_MEDTR|nr:hypothetical protein MtrunA17_Chr7g0272041 [Medicago truncatula]